MARLRSIGSRLAPAGPRGPAAMAGPEPRDKSLYHTARWQRLRWKVLERDRFTCRRCGRIEAKTARLVADHIVPARLLDEVEFFDERNLQTLCKRCHDADKQREERARTGRGWSNP